MSVSSADFLERAWADHAQAPDDVTARVLERISLENEANWPPLIQLLAHIYLEHKTDGGVGFDKISQIRSTVISLQAKTLALAALSFAAGNDDELMRGQASGVDLSALAESDLAASLAQASSSLAGRGEIAKARKFFEQSISIVEKLTKTDQAIRALAVTANNLASSLERKESRTDGERSLMLDAAHAARKFWEMAGNWKHVERAEYRLAHSYLKAGNPAAALQHAEHCLAIVKENSGDGEPLEVFFGLEALTLAKRALGLEIEAEIKRMKAVIETVAPSDRAWCEPALASITTAQKN